MGELALFDSEESKRQYNTAYSTALSEWPVPFEERYVPTTFGDTHVIVSGPYAGSPLVLLHPAGCGSVIWSRNIASLSGYFRTFAVDTIGEVNLSRVSRAPRSREDLLTWVDELFSGLEIERAHLAGNSFGGYLCTLVALFRPERVGRVVLISPAATFSHMWPWVWHFVPGYLIGSTAVKRRAYDWIWQHFSAEPWIVEMRSISSRCGTPKHRGPEVFTDEELGSISAPILLLVGDHEVVYDPVKVMERAMRAVPGLNAQMIPYANHNAEYTAAGEVNTRMLSFLTG